MTVCNIIYFYESPVANTGDLERRMCVCNVRKVHRPCMSVMSIQVLLLILFVHLRCSVTKLQVSLAGQPRDTGS